MMTRQRLREIKSAAKKFDFEPSTQLVHTLVDHGLDALTVLEQRRSAVAHQLRRLAIELTDLDRQLDEIGQSEGRGTPSALQGHTADQ